MSWHTLTNLTQGQLVTETHMDNIRENVEHLGDNIEIGGAAAKNFSGAISASRMVMGQYTGDGNATQAITGVGFQPDFLYITPFTETQYYGWKVDQEGTESSIAATGRFWEDDHIISLDSDGFTVGDGTGSSQGNQMNVNTVDYVYIAWKS